MPDTLRSKPLGRNGPGVPEICLGTMTFGEQTSEADAHAQLDYALAHGVNFIDTADASGRTSTRR